MGLSSWVSEVDGDLGKEGISLAPGGHMRFVFVDLRTGSWTVQIKACVC